MSWAEIKAQLHARYVHAIAQTPTEVRLVLGFGRSARDRIAMVVRPSGDRAIVNALVDFEKHLDLDLAARFAESWNISLVSVGDRICVRAVLDPKRVEESLQATGRTALRMRYAACLSLTTEQDTYAYVL
jgi:hypothetical protein